MSATTLIPWCDSTWNPWIGCDKVSPGCANCYITNTSPLRIRGMKHGDPRVEQSEAVWNMPFRLNRKPWVCDDCGKPKAGEDSVGSCDGCGEITQTFHRQRIFTLSLGDWLDPKVPIEWLARMLDTMRQCPDVNFLTVTKRPELWYSRLDAAFLHSWEDEDRTGKAGIGNNLSDWIADWIKQASIPKNVWVLTSAENQDLADKRIPELMKIPAAVRGLSCEPLLGPIRFNLATRCDTGNCQHYTDAECPGTNGKCIMQASIDWIITGGESGKGARPCNVEWIRSIKDQCAAAGVPCFVKQLGSNSVYSAKAIRNMPYKHSKGGDINEFPEDLKVRQFPEVKR